MRTITTALRKWSLLFLVLLIPAVSGIFPLLSETAYAAPNNTPSSGAQDNCQNQTGNAQKACETGYDNPNDSKACDSYKGSDKTACTDAQSTAKNNGSNGSSDTTPTCDASVTNPMSWVLCPIFDLISDATHWLFQSVVQPFLITQPISTDPKDMIYQIWSNFRIYGDIFLVIALLVIVFSESIGGGMLDAYTVKKVLPRLLAAAVMINLSIYIVAFLVDFTNILGAGMSSLLAAPLTHCTQGAGNGNCWDFKLSAGQGLDVFGVGLVGLLAGGTALAGAIGALIFGGAAAASTMLTAAFFVALPVLFAILGVFLTLVFRKGLILFLVLSSPVACALYVLPNTSRYFKRWWDLLIEALMVYPIIIIVFGVADILSVTILQANKITPTSLTGSGDVSLDMTLALVTAFMLQFLPLLAIPFAFRFASGALRRIYDAATTAGAQVHKAATSRREHAVRDYKAESLAARARVYHEARGFGERHKGPLGVGRSASRWVGRRAGGYNIEQLMSGQRAETGKELNDIINTGRDEEIRGLTVNKQWALDHGVKGVDWTEDSNGVRSFRSLGGKMISEQDVDAGHARWGRNQFAQQAALSYEMRKAIDEGDIGMLAANYRHVAGTEAGGWGMTEGEAQGAFTGAAFENQNQHLEFKYTDAKTGQLNNDKDFVNEIYERRGSYNMSQMSSHTIEQLKEAHRMAESRGDLDQQEKIAAISETFMHQFGGGGPVHVPEEGEPEYAAGGDGRRTASVQGAAHVAERVVELAKMTGTNPRSGAPVGGRGTANPSVYDQAPTGPYTRRPTNNREQT